MSTFIDSAQLQPNGQPRFRIPAHPEHPAWDAAAAEEAAGGVEADVRIFLDAQCGEGDVVVDLDPGFGFVALTAATATSGMPQVLVYGLSASDGQRVQDAAADAGAWLDTFAAAELGAVASEASARLGDEGRLFVHCRTAHVPGVCTALLPQREADRLLAICVSDAHTAGDWSAAARALGDIGLAPAYLAEQQGQVVLLPEKGTPTGPIIAIPADLLP